LNTTLSGFNTKQEGKQNDQNDGTVVLQATLVMGNQQFSHAFKNVKSMKNTL
jgi:hypothetical protein